MVQLLIHVNLVQILHLALKLRQLEQNLTASTLVKLLPEYHCVRLCSFVDSPIAAITCTAMASQMKRSPGDEISVISVSVIAQQIHQ